MKKKRAILLIAYGLFITIITGIFSKCQSQTPSEVYRFCVKIGVHHPEIVTAQSILETGHYKCKSCSLDYQNIFGLRYKKKYLKFNHWKRSVYYYLHWQQRKGSDQYDDYYLFLKEVGYATDSLYIEKVKSLEI